MIIRLIIAGAIAAVLSSVFATGSGATIMDRCGRVLDTRTTQTDFCNFWTETTVTDSGFTVEMSSSGQAILVLGVIAATAAGALIVASTWMLLLFVAILMLGIMLLGAAVAFSEGTWDSGVIQSAISGGSLLLMIGAIIIGAFRLISRQQAEDDGAADPELVEAAMAAASEESPNSASQNTRQRTNLAIDGAVTQIIKELRSASFDEIAAKVQCDEPELLEALTRLEVIGRITIEKDKATKTDNYVIRP